MARPVPHLHKRNGVYYYRRRVPLALHQAVGRQIVQFSLNTLDRREAVRLKAIHDVRWDAQFQALSRQTSGHSAHTQGQELSSGEVIRIVRDYVSEADNKRAQAFLADPPHSEAERAEMQADADMELSILGNRDDPRSHEHVYAATERLFGLPEGLNHAVGELVRQALVEIAKRRFARISGDETKTHFSKIFDPAAAQEVNFEDAAKQYLDWTTAEATANGVNRKWLDKQAANVATLVELVGNIPVRAINFDSCQSVRRGLASMPAHRNKLFPGIPLQEAVQRAQSGDHAILSPTTQKQYLDTFRGILGLAARKGIIGCNPAERLEPLKRDVLPARQKRKPFSPEQLKAIFSGSYYTKCSKALRPYEADKNGWRFWLPLLCLFLGLRPNEACQMNASDVKVTQAGTHYLDIVETTDEGEGLEGKTLKTIYSRRKIPIHPELIRMGFIEYAQKRQGAGKSAMLFQGLSADNYGSYSKYPLRRFRETFLPQEVKLEKRQSFYSFRHNFRDAMRIANTPPATLQAVGGWSQGRLVSDDYGDNSNPDLHAPFIAAVSFPELDFSALYCPKAL